jgi:hypothetical protein
MGLGSPLYYVCLSAACLAMVIYNFNISSSSSHLQCFSIEKGSIATANQYYDTLGSNETKIFIEALTGLGLNDTIPVKELDTNKKETETPVARVETLPDQLRFLQQKSQTSQTQVEQQYSIPKLKPNKLGPVQKAIGIIYIIILILSLFLTLIIGYMSDMVPEDFLKVGKIKMLLACCCKVFPLIIIFVHWIAFILIIVEWGFLGSKECIKSNNIVDPDKYYTESFTLNIVTSAFWIVIHYFGAIMREIMYQEPFMYAPDVGQPSFFRQFFLKRLGP